MNWPQYNEFSLYMFLKRENIDLAENPNLSIYLSLSIYKKEPRNGERNKHKAVAIIMNNKTIFFT